MGVHPIQPTCQLVNSSTEIIDFRSAINPKHPADDADFVPRRYYQVYERKHGFQPNLSILDLLFNMGPESVFWL
ncbi:MAG: WbqC family protein [Prevotella sp.]|nr:WbqC family protein [Prevotella sp.]